MAKFMYIYHGGTTPESPEEGEKVMKAWTSWMEGLGASLVDGGNPAGPSRTVSKGGVSENGGANPVSGYSLVEAKDMSAAVDMARGCPIVDAGGSVEVAEALAM